MLLIMIQFLIAMDQVLNTLAWAKLEGFGFADETLSARMWRLQASSNWNRARIVVDWVFGNIFNDKNHCQRSYLDEYYKYQLPGDYRKLIEEPPEWFKKHRLLS